MDPSVITNHCEDAVSGCQEYREQLALTKLVRMNMWWIKKILLVIWILCGHYRRYDA